MKLTLREDRMLMPEEGRQLREQIAMLRAALAPFAKAGEKTHQQLDWEGDPISPEMDEDEYFSVWGHDILVKHFRAAEAAMKESGGMP